MVSFALIDKENINNDSKTIVAYIIIVTITIILVVELISLIWDYILSLI